MKIRLLLICSILCFGSLLGAAQTSKEKPAPTNLTLEINFYKGKPPAYQAIYESAANSKWAWFAMFRRVPGFQNSADLPFVRAVKFEWYLEKETVKVNVSVLSGRLHDDEKTVGVYTLRENERTSVKELTNFGAEPFEIAVVRVASSVPVMPSVEYKTNSLQVIGIEPQAATLPTNKISILNNHSKAVNYFSYEILVNGEKTILALKGGEKDNPLIEAGGTYEMLVANPLEIKKISSGEIPPVRSEQTIVLTSVMFTDGSFEGDRFTAARFRAYSLGRKLQLKQIISLIEMNNDKQKKLDSNKLAEQALNLKVIVDEERFNELIKNFPDLSANDKSSVRFCVQVGSQRVKENFVKELETRLQNSGSIGDWLKDTKEDYRNWLARIY